MSGEHILFAQHLKKTTFDNNTFILVCFSKTSNFSIDRYKAKTVQSLCNYNAKSLICTVIEQVDHNFPVYLLHYFFTYYF